MTRGMQDNLEKFVKENRNEFDSLTPKESTWKGIHAKLNESAKKAHTKIIFWRAAAIILFAFSIGISFYSNKDFILKSSPKVVYDSEFINTEKYYTTVINERQELITMVARTYPDVKSDFELDWKTLDQSYAKLKDEYSKNQSSEILIALVQNLRSRVDLLNRQIEILESIERDEKEFFEI